MRRILLAVILPLIVAGASLWNVVEFRLSNLLRPAWPEAVTLSLYGAVALIVVFLLLALTAARRGARLGWLRVVVAIVVMAAAGFLPRAVDLRVADVQRTKSQEEGADFEMEFQSDYLDRSDDLEARIAAKKKYGAEEALDLIHFAVESDLSYRSLPDHTPEAFDLVRQALDAGMLDPNALATPPVADSPPRTVTLAFYEAEILPNSPHTIERHDWDMLQLLIAHGADTSGPGAARLRKDLALTPSATTGRYISLH
jgi:hypothetical protein